MVLNYHDPFFRNNFLTEELGELIEKCHGIIFCYDITSKASYEHVKK